VSTKPVKGSVDVMGCLIGVLSFFLGWTCGRAESIVDFIPVDDAPLLRHIRKQKKRAERRKHSSSRKSHKDFEQLFGSDDMTVRCFCLALSLSLSLYPSPSRLFPVLSCCFTLLLLLQEAEGLDDGSDGDAGFDAMPKARASNTAPYKRCVAHPDLCSTFPL
jgi:hypothetical protein